VCRLHSRLLGRKRVSSIIDGDLHVLPLLARRLRSSGICVRLGSANSNPLCGVSVDLELLEELQDNVRWVVGAEVSDGGARHRGFVALFTENQLGGQLDTRAS